MQINIGSGSKHLSGWVNIDIRAPADLVLDVRKGLPYDDGVASYIYSRDFIEHLTVGEAIAHLKDCYRILKPDGVLRVATPDLCDMLRHYVHGTWRDQSWASGFSTAAEAVNWRFYQRGEEIGQEHKHLYDREELKRILQGAGFSVITLWPPNVSDHKALQWQEAKFMLVAEATK